MKQIRIGNDIKFSLSLTGEVADAIAWHVFVKESAPEMPKGTIVLNGRKEHCHGRVIELAAVQVSSSVSGKTVTAVWTADKQMLGVWDVIVTAETASGSKGAADVQRVVEITKHTGTSAGDAAGTVTEVVALGTLSITFSGMSAYELAVSKGYTGTVTEWLLSLKGAKGDTGATGAAGHSPVISTRKYGGVTTVYMDGTAVAEINDGAKGDKGDTGATGQTGAAGADGKSAIVISVWSDDEPLVEAGKYMYEPTAKKLWLGYTEGASLKKKQVQMMSNMLYLYNNNIYVFDGTELVISDSSQKPADGWAKSDLNESVQASLNKADSALQTHQDMSGKQDVISDLTTIRSGAALGATALQPVQGKGLSTNDYTDADKAEVAKVSQVGAEIGQLSSLETTEKSDLVSAINEVKGDIPDVSGKQDTLVSGTNIKTINNQSILGSGNINIEGGGGGTEPPFLLRYIVGYSVTKTQPDDWETNYTNYYRKVGNAEDFVYEQITDDTAPTWVAATYYSYNSSGVNNLRIRQASGFNFPSKTYKKIIVRYSCPKLSSSRTGTIGLLKLGYATAISAIRISDTLTDRDRLNLFVYEANSIYSKATIEQSPATSENKSSVYSKITGSTNIAIDEIMIGIYSGANLPSGTKINVYGE